MQLGERQQGEHVDAHAHEQDPGCEVRQVVDASPAADHEDEGRKREGCRQEGEAHESRAGSRAAQLSAPHEQDDARDGKGCRDA